MNTWHPKSYSEQTRNRAERLFQLYAFADFSFEECMAKITNSYRNQTFRYRTAKAFGRKLRKALDKQKL